MKYLLKIRANLKRHNRVHILPSKHTYRPMRVRLVAQLLYNVQYDRIVQRAYWRLSWNSSIFFFIVCTSIEETINEEAIYCAL